MKNDELNPRIKIRSPLRCDGIGRLDCAEDTESGARMAVRWLPLDANGESAVKACAKLPEHPTLPRVHQTGVTGDKAFLAMEFPDGKLLATMVGETVSGELLLEAGAQLADALATIHSQAVVHGEMSAESVLIAKGKAFLWDMPLVIANRLTDRRGEERLMHQLVRTAPFMAPERARGGPPSPECDVYGLAAVMCLAGGSTMPPAGTTLSVVHAIVSGDWAPTVPAVFHEPYRGLLTRMLSRDPAQRPSAREVADLLGKPAGAIPTIPEMPAIVLPVLVPPPAQRPAPKTPYAAAPGSLEPMLPPKAVADAAKALPTKPLQVTVPTQVEPTVKVSVPVQVLVAMSQPIAVDAELKRVVETLKPVVTSEAIPTVPHLLPPTTTLEFGLPKKPTPPPMPAAAAAASVEKQKTPTPVQAVVVSELKAALEAAAEAHAVSKADEAPAAAITAPNPPPMPRKSSKEMPPPAAVIAEAFGAPAAVDVEAKPGVAEVFEGPLPEPKGAVEVQENVCISAETYAAGAGALADEPLDGALQSKPTFLIAAALLAVLTTGLAFGARALTGREVAPAPVAQVQVTAPAPVVAPAKAEEAEEEDELSSLPAPKRKAQVRRAAPAAQAPSKLQGKYDSHGEAGAAPLADDFSFLNDNGAASGASSSGGASEAPKEDLKRPEF